MFCTSCAPEIVLQTKQKITKEQSKMDQGMVSKLLIQLLFCIKSLPTMDQGLSNVACDVGTIKTKRPV